MPYPSPSTLTVLHSNFLQLERRSGGWPQLTVYPGRLPVSCDTHYSVHNLPIVSPTRSTSSATDSPNQERFSALNEIIIQLSTNIITDSEHPL